jgi:hypothetical protein
VGEHGDDLLGEKKILVRGLLVDDHVIRPEGL